MQKADRREKRRLLDAQRGKCRVRLGSHLDEWCVLKDHLGFSLHSQLAKFLLNSYRTTTSPKSPAPKPIALLSVSGPSLQHLAFLCHQHGRNCNCPLSILAQPCSLEVPETRVLLWGCKEDHQFYWDPRDCSAELDGDKTKEDVIGVPSPHHHRTTRQENVAKKTAEYGPVINIENKVNLQRTAMKPHSIAIHETLYEKQSGSDANSCPVNVDVEQEQCNDTRRITEHTLEERQHMTPGNQLPLKPDVFEQQQKPVTVTSDGLSQCIGLEILVSSAEIGDTEEEDAGLQSVGVSEDTKESFSIDLVNEQPKALCSGQGCRHQRCHNQPSQSHQQALKPELPFICRRSPRGRKGSRTKADVKEQVSHSKVQLTSVSRVTSDVKGQVVGVHGSPPNTNLTKRMSHMEETLTEDVTRRKTPSENFEGLAADEEQKEPLPAESQHKSAQTSRAVNREQDTQMEVHENEELHNNQCKDKKTSRCKSIIDEELAQICKKRIRKATPQELLMCEYDDCGKIFSKRQYLNEPEQPGV
ncbi:zinc finger protein 692-like isoform X2 [Bufo gargarizans]|uniref:zinc finger protein 692-like isoform X2 n=1 Tax=Bufo gargarizans TaxID=30331 RepID=UPI001CF4316C|nr:zinc finger protein 692-like isoform X2 [Bufo gargarizans]